MRILLLSLTLFCSLAAAQTSHLADEWYQTSPSFTGLQTMQSESPGAALQPEKNRGKAFFMSLLVPGWGQRYTESRNKMLAFFAAEIGLWMTCSGFELYSDWRRQDYRAYAARYADVDLDGKSDSYFIDVGNFNTIHDYNAYKLQWRQLAEYYDDVDANYWNWQSKEHREEFDDLRISSDTAHNRATMMLGFIMANHVISAVDALISASRHHNQQTVLDWNLFLGDGYYTPRVHFTLTKHW
ncbi:MAG: DUF5683 domain-containing protein [candidate division KSB1 bacterium]|nr:DUF5683 domain-containing protein [candidate division KSB1 bacterium]